MNNKQHLSYSKGKTKIDGLDNKRTGDIIRREQANQFKIKLVALSILLCLVLYLLIKGNDIPIPTVLKRILPLLNLSLVLKVFSSG